MDIQKQIEEITDFWDQPVNKIKIDLVHSDEIIKAAREDISELQSAIARQSKQLELAVKALEQSDEVLRDLHSQLAIDIDVNPSAKKVYLSKVAYVGGTVIRSSLAEIKRLSGGNETP